MAFHLNLYHEIHKQAARERRDPFKLAMLAGIVFMLLLTFWYFYRMTSVGSLETKSRNMAHQWTKLEPQLKASIEEEPKLLARQGSNQALVERLQNRFYWAPFLERLAAAAPSHVQIVALNGDVEVKEVDTKEKSEGKKAKQKTMTMLLRGVAAGTQPRTAADEFRLSLRKVFSEFYSEVSAEFDANSLENGVEMVQLEGEPLGTATFRIRLSFKPAVPPAPPTPEKSPAPKKTK